MQKNPIGLAFHTFAHRWPWLRYLSLAFRCKWDLCEWTPNSILEIKELPFSLMTEYYYAVTNNQQIWAEHWLCGSFLFPGCRVFNNEQGRWTQVNMKRAVCRRKQVQKQVWGNTRLTCSGCKRAYAQDSGWWRHTEDFLFCTLQSFSNAGARTILLNLIILLPWSKFYLLVIITQREVK